MKIEYRGTYLANRRPAAGSPGRCYQLYCSYIPTIPHDVGPTSASHDLLVLVSLYRGRSLARYILARHATLYNIAPSGGEDVFSSRVVSITSENIMTAVDSNQGTGKLSGRVGIVGTGHRGRVSLDVTMEVKSLPSSSRERHKADRVESSIRQQWPVVQAPLW